MLAAIELLKEAFPRAIFTLTTVPELHHQISAICSEKLIKIVDGDAALAETLTNCDAVMATSGTVTLEAALYGVPGVACYKAGWISATLGRMIVDMQKVILPNVILGREVYPFLFQENLTPNGLSNAVTSILNNPKAKSTALNVAQQLRAKLIGESKQFDKLVTDAWAKLLDQVPLKID